MLPPASSCHWRESEQSGVLISGQEIPIGCDVGVNTPALFRNRDIFRDADRFWPERWVKGVLPDEELRRARKTLTPFSIGPRNCPGQNAAMMIISISLANLINKYDFRLGSKLGGAAQVGRHKRADRGGTGAELHFESHFHSGWKDGPYIQFRERLE